MQDAQSIRMEELDVAKQKLRDSFDTDLADELLQKIEQGSVDLEKYKTDFTELFGEEEAEKKYKIVVDTVEAQDKLEDLFDKEKDLVDKIAEDTKNIFELQLDAILAEMEVITSEADDLEHALDMKDVLGQVVTSGDYERLIRNADDQIRNLERQKEVIQDELDSLDPDENSAEWYELNKKLADCNSQMNNLIKQQEEWNYQIKRLPIERINKYVNVLENILKDLDNFSAEEAVYDIDTTEKLAQQRMSIWQTEFESLTKQANEIQKLRDETQFGSEKYNELNDELQGTEDKLSGIIQSMRELAKSLLQLPVDKIQKLNERLEKSKDLLQADQEINDATLASINDVIDKKREQIEDERDFINDQLQDEIDKYQDVLDLLNEQNEARRVRIDLENAQYNLDKARQQRNIQVVRNGRIEYDSDMAAVRDAEQGLNDAEYSKRQYDLQQSIDKLSKQQEENNKKAQDQLDTLDDISKKYNDIADVYDKEANATTATGLLGKGWQDKILSGNDQDLYKTFKDAYVSNERQIAVTEKEITKNEQLATALSDLKEAMTLGEDHGGISFERGKELSQYLAKISQDTDGFTNSDRTEFYKKLYGVDSLGALNSNTLKDVNALVSGYKNTITLAESIHNTAEKDKKSDDERLELAKKEYEQAKKNYEELQKIEQNTAKSSSRRRSNRRDDDDDDENDPGEFSKNPTRYGAHTSKNPYSGTLTGDEVESRRATDDNTEAIENLTKAVDEWSRDYQEAHGATGPARDLEPHSDGLKYGPVGMMSSSDKFNMLQKLSLTKLDPNEVPTLLHRGEAVLNQNQINTVLENMATLSRQSLAPVPVSNSRSSTTQINMTFGDLNLPNVHDANSFAESIKMNFELAMNQQFSKR